MDQRNVTFHGSNGPLSLDGSVHLSNTNHSVTINGDQGTLLTIKPNGTIEIGEGLSPDKATQKAAELLVKHFYKFLDNRFDAAIARAKQAESDSNLTVVGFIGQPQLNFLAVNGGYRKTCVYSYDFTAGSIPFYVLTETLKNVRKQRALQTHHEKS